MHGEMAVYSTLVAGQPPRSALLGARFRSIDESSIGAFNCYLTGLSTRYSI
jgi:hypothetical protein